MPYLQRKYVDLIRSVSSKWANWDPPIPVEVGAYGEVESETGDLAVEGNIYDPDFQDELNKLDLRLRLADHQPVEGPIEDDFIIATKGAKRIDLHLTPEASIAGLATASFKGQWQFERGKRDALLVMHRPRLKYLPRNVILDTLYRVPRLKDKWLVTGAHLCPAYSMYISNKSGETVTLALVAQLPVAGIVGANAGVDGGFSWFSDCQADLSRKACDKQGNYCYTPLYMMKRHVGWAKRLFRADDDPEEQPPQYAPGWIEAPVPWDPLDEDGEEDSVSMQDEDLGSF